jgi:hypothetical protein
MAPNKELLTVQHFKAWQRVNAAALQEADERNQRAVDDYVIRSLTTAMKDGMSMNEAGDILLDWPPCGFRDGVHYTPKAFRRALRSTGWIPPRERNGRG